MILLLMSHVLNLPRWVNLQLTLSRLCTLIFQNYIVLAKSQRA